MPARDRLPDRPSQARTGPEGAPAPRGEESIVDRRSNDVEHGASAGKEQIAAGQAP